MNDKDETTKAVISDRSAIRVGLALTIGAYIGLSAWWASGIQSKLDVLLNGQKISQADFNGIRTRVESLERSTELFNQVGSPALRPRIEALEKSVDRINTAGSPKLAEMLRRVEELENQFAVHKASTKP